MKGIKAKELLPEKKRAVYWEIEIAKSSSSNIKLWALIKKNSKRLRK
jgi:hypothetical protein